jgi:hypothetical protein
MINCFQVNQNVNPILLYQINPIINAYLNIASYSKLIVPHYHFTWHESERVKC